MLRNYLCRASRACCWLIATACFLAAAPRLDAQSPADAKRNGERAYANGRWQEAQRNLALYQEAKPGDLGVLTKLGISLYQLRRVEEAKRYLEYVTAKAPQSGNPEQAYYLARCWHSLGDWDKAIAAYKSFLRTSGERHPLRANVIDNIRRCVSGMGAKPDERVALVENLGDRVNSPGDEFAPLPSLNHAGRLYFAAAKPGSTGGRRNDAGFEDTQRGHWCSDMYTAQLGTTGWELKGALGGLLNTARFEVPLGFNHNGQVLYLYRGLTLYSGDIFADTASVRDEYSIEPPAWQGPVIAAEGDQSPWFVDDNTVVFASRRKGGYGGLDLWWSMRSDSGWTEPANLGPMVNSAYDEDTPFLARDGITLYFSSNRTESIGGFDVFKAVFDEKKRSWASAQALGTPINSPDDDLFFRLSPDGGTAFFASDRVGSLGQRDLFIAYFKEEATEQLGEAKGAVFAQKNAEKALEPIINDLTVPVLLYQNDRDLLAADNLRAIEKMAGFARSNPAASVIVTVYTENSGQPKFDLYNGIKRAEIVGKSLNERGVPFSQMVLRSVGAAYPFVREMVEGLPNPTAATLNRRVELALQAIDPLPLRVRTERPAVAPQMTAFGFQKLDDANTGLTYRVEAATVRQILTNEAIAMFDDLMIEASAEGSGFVYRYSTGIFRQHKEALGLLKDLQAQGFMEAKVVAFINGVRLPKSEAVAYLKKYPDLVGYVKG
jgi:outer membrane protein OmpA-like peptidoglycan-associated protein